MASMDVQLQIFTQECEELLISCQMNMRKLTINNVQLSDLMQSSVQEYTTLTKECVQSANEQIKQCLQMQDEFLQLEALQKKIQIFRLLCDDMLLKKENEYQDKLKQHQDKLKQHQQQ